jgi:hypothetical protein
MHECLFAMDMSVMRLIQPGNDDGRVHQNHGRVLRSNSAPETLPSHVPERARI